MGPQLDARIPSAHRLVKRVPLHGGRAAGLAWTTRVSQGHAGADGPVQSGYALAAALSISAFAISFLFSSQLYLQIRPLFALSWSQNDLRGQRLMLLASEWYQVTLT